MESIDREKLSFRIKTLFDIYDPAYRPPMWIINANIINQIITCMKDTVVYFDSNDNLSTNVKNVKLLTSMREPVNIACKKYYYQNALYLAYGYTNSIYGSTHNSVNISIFTRTPFQPANELNNYNNNFIINLLSVCSPAFDSKEQPDFLFFGSNQCKNTIHLRFALIFKMIFECAIRKEMNHIMLIGFGLGAFGNSVKDYAEGLRITYNTYKTRLQENNIKLYYCDYNKNSYNNITESIDVKMSFLLINYDFLYEAINQISNQCDISKVLFINAWDPHSILGNGNFADRSWDGHWGRRTAISVLGFPHTNPHIQYIDIATH